MDVGCRTAEGPAGFFKVSPSPPRDQTRESEHSRKGFHANPTPICRLHPELRRRNLRSESIPPGPLPAMRGQTPSDRSWILLPHTGGCRLRRSHPCSTLPVSLLSTHCFFASRVRIPLAPFQRLRDRALPRRPATQRSHPRG